MDEHRNDAAIEDARFLMDQGFSIEHAARRVGLTVDALQKKFDRERDRAQERARASAARRDRAAGPGPALDC